MWKKKKNQFALILYTKSQIKSQIKAKNYLSEEMFVHVWMEQNS